MRVKNKIKGMRNVLGIVRIFAINVKIAPLLNSFIIQRQSKL